MNATQPGSTDVLPDVHTSVNWATTIRLGIVLSLVAAIAALGFASYVGEQTLVVSVIAIASAVTWLSLDRLVVVHRPARVKTR